MQNLNNHALALRENAEELYTFIFEARNIWKKSVSYSFQTLKSSYNVAVCTNNESQPKLSVAFGCSFIIIDAVVTASQKLSKQMEER